MRRRDLTAGHPGVPGEAELEIRRLQDERGLLCAMLDEVERTSTARAKSIKGLKRELKRLYKRVAELEKIRDFYLGQYEEKTQRIEELRLENAHFRVMEDRLRRMVLKFDRMLTAAIKELCERGACAGDKDFCPRCIPCWWHKLQEEAQAEIGEERME